MLGRVSIASIALLHNLTDAVTVNIQKALAIATKLKGQPAELNANTIKFGKLKYRSAAGEIQYYWLPMENDTFVVNNLDSEYLQSKKAGVEEEDAQIVYSLVALDTKRELESLQKAAAAMSAKNYSEAQIALFTAMHSTISEETISELPLVTAHDNLVLARELFKSKELAGARFALNHAKEAMTEYQKTAGKEKSTQAKNSRLKSASCRRKSQKTNPPLQQRS